MIKFFDQTLGHAILDETHRIIFLFSCNAPVDKVVCVQFKICLLYTSDAADERSSVDLGGRRIIKKNTKNKQGDSEQTQKDRVLKSEKREEKKS